MAEAVVKRLVTRKLADVKDETRARELVRRILAPTGSGGIGPPGTDGSRHGVTRSAGGGHAVGADTVIS